MGCLVVEALPGSIIQGFHHQCNFFFRDSPEVGSLGEIVPQETIGILISAPLPGSVGIGKIDFQSGLCFELFELREFFPVIDGQRVAESPWHSPEECDALCRHGRGFLVGELYCYEISAFPFCVSGKAPCSFPSFHGIAFPVAEAFTRRDNGRTEIDGDPSGNESPSGAIPGLSVAVFVTSTEMAVKIALVAGIQIDPAVNRFMADAHGIIVGIIDSETTCYSLKETSRDGALR